VERIHDLAPPLASHGVDVDEVLATQEGHRPSILSARPGALKLDHLESFLRSGRAHGRLTEPPERTLERLWVADGAVHTDRSTADYLAELAIGEAEYLCSWENAVANGVVRGLVARLIDQDDHLLTRIPRMTDDELWSELLTDPSTAEHAHRLRRDPLGWEMLLGEHDVASAYSYQVNRLYLSTACVDGTPIPLPVERADTLPTLPWRCWILPTDHALHGYRPDQDIRRDR